jgi:hypothetical protein
MVVQGRSMVHDRLDKLFSLNAFPHSHTDETVDAIVQAQRNQKRVLKAYESRSLVDQVTFLRQSKTYVTTEINDTGDGGGTALIVRQTLFHDSTQFVVL